MAFSIQRHFGDLPDPRRAQGRRHRLSDPITIAACAVACCADSWADVADFGRAKADRGGPCLELPHGTPCQDTFERCFARLDPDAFERCFAARTTAPAGSSAGKLVAVDGKRMRRSFEHAWDHSTATHLASAFVAENRTVFGRLAVDGKANGVVAIPKLLELLGLRGATVTTDAMGCRTAIAGQIVRQGGGHLLAAKGNQPTRHARVERNVDAPLPGRFAGVRHGHVRTVDGDHGRIETRDVWGTDDLARPGEEKDRWPGPRSLAVVESERDVPLKGVSAERRYYISSRHALDATVMAGPVRGHWSVENNLHWVLAVGFDEDRSRRRKGHSAANFSRLRRIALDLLNREKGRRRGVRGKRLNAAWDHDYLLKLLAG